MKFVIALAVLIQCVFADRICRRPEPYYNTFINSDLADKCEGDSYTALGPRAPCLAAVHMLCLAPRTEYWIKGVRVNADNCSKIKKNTAIASFTGPNGEYLPKSSHSGIFISCYKGNIVIADQWCGKRQKFSERTLYKDCKSINPAANCADLYHTIEW